MKKMVYRFVELSKEERELIEEMLLEELEEQRWYAIEVVPMFNNEEVILCAQ